VVIGDEEPPVNKKKGPISKLIGNLLEAQSNSILLV